MDNLLRRFTMEKEFDTRTAEVMPFDHTFEVNGREELCHATGMEMFIDGTWWNEYMDSNGDLHYGN